MNNVYDVIVAGTGAMGSAACYHLAKRRKKVLGIDRYSPPHKMGSSHGQTRIIREAYFEGPQYVPIIQQSYTNWEKLEKDYGQQLYLKTGGLIIGTADSDIVKGAQLSANLYHLPYEILTAAEIRKRYPAFHVGDDVIAIWEPKAGILFPEKCIDAHLQLAASNGAEFSFNEIILSWEAKADGVSVTTSNGKYYAKQLLLTTGAWLNNFLQDINLPLTIERQVLYWFKPSQSSQSFNKDRFPVFIFTPATDKEFYGFPDLGNGIKIAMNHHGETANPDTINRQVKEKEVQLIRSFLEEFIPDANGELLSTETCMYTNTTDFHFRIVNHPEHAQVLIASICSGHGFKFSSGMGEILADLLSERKSSFDLSLFQPSV